MIVDQNIFGIGKALLADLCYRSGYLRTKSSIKIKGYQSQKLYTTNDIPMGKNTLTSELKRNKQLMNKSNPSTYMKITKQNFNLNEHNPVIHL